MPVLRRFLVVVVVLAAVAGFASSRALATPPPDCTIVQPEVLSSPHFDVYYNSDKTQPAPITETQAGNLAASAEKAYAAFAAMGFPAPADDGFGRIDIQVLDLTAWNISGVTCYGAFNFDFGTVGSANEGYTTGETVFAEIDLNLFDPNFWDDVWLPQSIESWASWKALGYPAESTDDLGPFDMSLDCYPTGGVGDKCSLVGFENLGHSRWPFYEYLSERFGNSFITELLQSAATADDSVIGLQNALAAHGTTLTATYNAFATKVMAGGWTAPSLNVAALPISGEPIMTGISTGDLPAQSFNVNHLATRYVEIDRGDGAADHPCYAATLTITVQIPAGVSSQPAFYWNGGTSSVDLAISGSTATTTVPWDTCMWTNKGFLSLPNPTTDKDGMSFTVSEHLTVDTNAPANAKVPPAPATPFGTIVNVPTAGLVPAISVFGPELLTLAAGATQIRLIIESSGEGSVAASIGSVSLGSGTLRPGGNDLRFTLPAGTLATLRSTMAAGPMILSLTPTSSDGKATGPAVKQQLSIAPTAKAAAAKKQVTSKAKAKAAAQAKAKAKAKAKAAAKAKTKIKIKIKKTP
jgi:hypothetical protein